MGGSAETANRVFAAVWWCRRTIISMVMAHH